MQRNLNFWAVSCICLSFGFVSGSLAVVGASSLLKDTAGCIESTEDAIPTAQDGFEERNAFVSEEAPPVDEVAGTSSLPTTFEASRAQNNTGNIGEIVYDVDSYLPPPKPETHLGRDLSGVLDP